MTAFRSGTIRRIVAPNPSPMTFRGTNGYIVGREQVALVDPGPDDDDHLARWLEAIGSARVSHVLVSHAHRDHSALARRLADRVDAPVAAFGPPEAGRSETMRTLAASGAIAGGEGVDEDFRTDATLKDGDALDLGDVRIDVLHTPGHFPGHLAFAVGDVVLTGDHVMGWASTMISPPEGDVRDFITSCARLRARRDRLFLPGHGEPVLDTASRLDWLMAHRRQRERQILETLASGPADIASIVSRLYADTPTALRPAASRSVLAHLVALRDDGVVVARPALSTDATFEIA